MSDIKPETVEEAMPSVETSTEVGVSSKKEDKHPGRSTITYASVDVKPVSDDLGPLPTLDGKSEDEVQSLLSKAAKQGELRSNWCNE